MGFYPKAVANSARPSQPGSDTWQFTKDMYQRADQAAGGVAAAPSKAQFLRRIQGGTTDTRAVHPLNSLSPAWLGRATTIRQVPPFPADMDFHGPAFSCHLKP